MKGSQSLSVHFDVDRQMTYWQISTKRKHGQKTFIKRKFSFFPFLYLVALFPSNLMHSGGSGVKREGGALLREKKVNLG